MGKHDIDYSLRDDLAKRIANGEDTSEDRYYRNDKGTLLINAKDLDEELVKLNDEMLYKIDKENMNKPSNLDTIFESAKGEDIDSENVLTPEFCQGLSDSMNENNEEENQIVNESENHILNIKFLVGVINSERKVEIATKNVMIYGEYMKCIGFGKVELEVDKLFVWGAIRKDCYEALALDCGCDKIYPQLFYHYKDIDFYKGIKGLDIRMLYIDSVYLSNVKPLEKIPPVKF